MERLYKHRNNKTYCILFGAMLAPAMLVNLGNAEEYIITKRLGLMEGEQEVVTNDFANAYSIWNSLTV